MQLINEAKESEGSYSLRDQIAGLESRVILSQKELFEL